MTNLRLAAVVLLSSLLACEPRIEEPVPPARDIRPDSPITARGTPGQTDANGAPDPKKAEENGRCLFATPDKPKRSAPPPGPDPTCPADTDTPPKLRSGKIVFPGAKDKPAEIAVEVAEKNKERMRGLMFRKSMPEDHGMIFVFNEPDVHQFWMHNTCIPLDMLFVDHDGYIVGIEENVPTMNDSTYSVPCPSNYVIEVNAGYCRRHGIVAGQKIQLDGV